MVNLCVSQTNVCAKLYFIETNVFIKNFTFFKKISK